MGLWKDVFELHGIYNLGTSFQLEQKFKYSNLFQLQFPEIPLKLYYPCLKAPSSDISNANFNFYLSGKMLISLDGILRNFSFSTHGLQSARPKSPPKTETKNQKGHAFNVYSLWTFLTPESNSSPVGWGGDILYAFSGTDTSTLMLKI